MAQKLFFFIFICVGVFVLKRRNSAIRNAFLKLKMHCVSNIILMVDLWVIWLIDYKQNNTLAYYC